MLPPVPPPARVMKVTKKQKKQNQQTSPSPPLLSPTTSQSGPVLPPPASPPQPSSSEDGASDVPDFPTLNGAPTESQQTEVDLGVWEEPPKEVTEEEVWEEVPVKGRKNGGESIMLESFKGIGSEGSGIGPARSDERDADRLSSSASFPFSTQAASNFGSSNANNKTASVALSAAAVRPGPYLCNLPSLPSP
jgi:hypothetical protein